MVYQNNFLLCGGDIPCCAFSFENNDVTPTGDFLEEIKKYITKKCKFYNNKCEISETDLSRKSKEKLNRCTNKDCLAIMDYIPNTHEYQKGGINNMAKLIERAKSYIASGKLKNISELTSIPIDIDVNEKVFAEGTDKEFTAEVFTVDDEEYKMPLTVLSSLKAILEENPDMKTFKVKKSGTGIGTEYTTIPLS